MDADPRGRGDHDVHGSRPDRLCEALLEVTDAGCGLVCAVDSPEHHSELVAPESADRVLGTEGLAESLRQLPQDVVAREVAQRVVDIAEAVEVEDGDGNDGVLVGAAADGLGQAVLKQGPVGQPGQRVVVDQEVDVGLRLLELPDVAEDLSCLSG